MENIASDFNRFLAHSNALPKPYSIADAARWLQQWEEAAVRHPDADLTHWMQQAAQPVHPARPMLDAVFGNSPYLSRLLLLYPYLLQDFTALGADKAYDCLQAALTVGRPDNNPQALMQWLRINKGKLALLVALCDISGAWPLEQVTGALSDFADACLHHALDALLQAAALRKEIQLPHLDSPSKDSGIIVLGMGKLGGHELNYSSDIDLIVFFEPDRLQYRGRHTEQHFMNKLAHDLVNIMQERTAHGYVFRTDLRLRPDPASTPPAVTTTAALYYYESVGQNWERAAMIKARPVAGDIEAGERFLKSIAPFMWRRSLDFAAINDIHSIKRQMDSTQGTDIQLSGHNIKLGQGGIREIEFYTQIHQLIWGGRQTSLRIRGTCDTLARLTDLNLIDTDLLDMLRESYAFLRKLEHRLQMVADEQTHSMPESAEGIAHISCFMGYPSLTQFEKDFLRCLNDVHTLYASSFQSAEQLGEEGNLVFTGVAHDPETLNTLRHMGYSYPEVISETVMGWHHGSRRATRTKRARELLTELMPVLLKRLSETANPDAAFLKFNEFLCNLPAGVQLFSLFNVNPHLLGLIADIMGSAPTLADTLSKSPELLDAVLYEDFYAALPSAVMLEQQLGEALAVAADFEEQMDGLRRFRNERQFQAGVQLLKRMISAQQAGAFLSTLADVVLHKALDVVQQEFTRTYGHIKDSRFAIIALGKLGSREMTFSSDIDLVFIYDVPDFEAISDGEKGFSASVYFNRFAQRYLNALSGMGREGRLYEVDTRLRPSGKQGLLAVSTKALAHYFEELAWTFEYMAFTKARVVYGTDSLKTELEDFIRSQLSKQRDLEKLRQDVLDMRQRIESEHGTGNPWDIKYVRGGLIDIDFMAQYLMLRHAPKAPGAKPGSASEIFHWLQHTGRLEAHTATALIDADRFLGQIFNMLRLCCDRQFDEVSAPPGLKKLLVESVREEDFNTLKKRLIAIEHSVHQRYIALLSD